MNRFSILASAWAALLVLGFALIILLGSPAETAVDELDAAYHPAAPVTQDAAEASAATIARLQYPTFAAAPKKVTKPTDFGVEHWVVEYTDTTGPTPRGLRVSIVVDTGHVEVTTYP